MKKPIKADRQSMIIEYIKNNGSVSNKEARELLLSGGTLREAQTAR
jgi:DeoR/GlpR family transcriptional regulator of sugar metabolism